MEKSREKFQFVLEPNRQKIVNSDAGNQFVDSSCDGLKCWGGAAIPMLLIGVCACVCMGFIQNASCNCAIGRARTQAIDALAQLATLLIELPEQPIAYG